MSSAEDWTIRIRHILDAIARIQDYTHEMTADSFAAHAMAVDAVVRNFQVIGEATRHIPKGVQLDHPEIPWTRMRDMRHVLVHRYEIVDLPTVWSTVQNDLPPIVPLLSKLLNEPGRL